MMYKILLLGFMTFGFQQVLKTEEDRYDEYTYVEYDNKDSEALCRSILTYDIELLKKLIVPGKEIAAINFLIPEMEINEDLEEFFSSSTFLHLLIDQIDSSKFEDLKSVFSQIEVDTYRAKLVELVRHTIEIGIDINTENFNGENALSIAANNGTVDMVELLIQSGANINQQDRYGYSVLHKVVLEQAETFIGVAFFTTFDSSCLLQDDEELSAQVKTRERIIKILIKNRADILIGDYLYGQTVLDYLDNIIEEVNEVLDYYEFDGVYSIEIFGYIIDVYNKKDLHNSLIVLKNELESLRKLLQK